MPRSISLPANLPSGFDQLIVRGQLSVSKETASKLRGFFKTDDDDFHRWLDEFWIAAERGYLLRARFAVHPAEEEAHVHYSITLDDLPPGADETEDDEPPDWEPFERALNALPTHEIYCSLVLQLDTAMVKTTVELPIEVTYPGMSRISGLRISEPDADNPNQHLRSVVIDQLGDTTLVIGSIKAQSASAEKILVSNYDTLSELTSGAYKKVDES